MTVRRLEKSDKSVALASIAKAKPASTGVEGVNFSRSLAAAAGMQEAMPILSTRSVSSNGERAPTPYQRREQLEQMGELLDTLEALGRDLLNDEVPLESDDTRQRLQETRDQALHSLSTAPENGSERELLHRTAVLATVELAKSDRGDYK
ncbi:hypothetical protein SIID45300_00368 [Candidatus Magnetaquicoccaceae bacterium FCR-1]|uniref:Uncharacterized protein n=1 Tax=Candidatus Magnetaquiglobus chichijimensis TaxID=3141448 RepID=A0ABQ0C5A3_9PROT